MYGKNFFSGLFLEVGLSKSNIVLTEITVAGGDNTTNPFR